MAVAVGMREQGLWDDTAGRWRYGAAKRISASAGISSTGDDVMRAGAILAYSRDMALEVLAGTEQLRATYDKVRKAQAEAVQVAARTRSTPGSQRRDPHPLALGAGLCGPSGRGWKGGWRGRCSGSSGGRLPGPSAGL